jgi:hypothetical protein
MVDEALLNIIKRGKIFDKNQFRWKEIDVVVSVRQFTACIKNINN